MKLTEEQVAKAFEATLAELRWINIYHGDVDFEDANGSSQKHVAWVLTRKLNEVLGES